MNSDAEFDIRVRHGEKPTKCRVRVTRSEVTSSRDLWPYPNSVTGTTEHRTYVGKVYCAVVLESHGAGLKEAHAVHRGGRACWLSGGARRQIARQLRCQYPKNRSMWLCHNSITRTSTSHGHYCSGHQKCRRHSVARCRPVANIAGPTDDEAGAGPVRPADAVGSFAALDPGRRSQAGHEKATSRRRGSPGLVVDHGKSAALKVRQAFSHGVKLLG